MAEQDRREHEGGVGTLGVEISASTWRDLLELGTAHLSRGGLFVPSSQPVEPGQHVDITVVLPDDSVVEIDGEVAHVVTAEQSEATGLTAGFGLRFDSSWNVDLAVIESLAACQSSPDDVDGVDEGYITLPVVLLSDGKLVERTSIHHARSKRHASTEAEAGAAERPAEVTSGKDSQPDVTEPQQAAAAEEAPARDTQPGVPAVAQGEADSEEARAQPEQAQPAEATEPKPAAAQTPRAGDTQPGVPAVEAPPGRDTQPEVGAIPPEAAEDRMPPEVTQGELTQPDATRAEAGTSEDQAEELAASEREEPLPSPQPDDAVAYVEAGRGMVLEATEGAPDLELDELPPSDGMVASVEPGQGLTLEATAETADLETEELSPPGGGVVAHAEPGRGLVLEPTEAEAEAEAEVEAEHAVEQEAEAPEQQQDQLPEPQQDQPPVAELAPEARVRAPTGQQQARAAAEGAEPVRRRVARTPPPVLAPGGDPIFGIDFGTSYTSISLADNDRVRLLEDDEGNSLMPSVVCFPEEGDPVVGWPARELMVTNPATTFVSPKRLLGRRYDDRQAEPFIGSSAVHMEEGPGGQVVARIYGEPIAIPQVCAEIFRKAAQVGQQATGIPVRRVMLSAPVGYHDERPAIRRAAELAGLTVVAMLDEPVSASMAFGLGREGNETVAVYDFGGGTFDFTLLEIKDRKITVLGEAGDPWLGGDDFDLALAEEAANGFWRRYKVDLRKRQVEWQRLLFYCEAAKRRLSREAEAEIFARGIVLSLRGPIDLKMPLDREIFAQLCGPLIDQSIELVDSCLSLLEIRPSDVDNVVMTGGVSRIPLVRRRVEEYFQRNTQTDVNPEHAIVLGNAIYGRFMQLTGRAPLLGTE